MAKAGLARLQAKEVDAKLVDPLDLALPTSFKPHFAYAQGKAPEPLDALAGEIAAADSYVMISPEYNHAMGFDTLTQLGWQAPRPLLRSCGD